MEIRIFDGLTAFGQPNATEGKVINNLPLVQRGDVRIDGAFVAASLQVNKVPLTAKDVVRKEDLSNYALSSTVTAGFESVNSTITSNYNTLNSKIDTNTERLQTDITAINNNKPSYATNNTFTGSNTFSKPVTVGTPTANAHAATKAYVDTAVAPLVTTVAMNAALAGYVTNGTLTTTLGDYVKTTDLTTTLGAYATKTYVTGLGYDTVTSVDNKLKSYTKTTDLNTTLAGYVTSSTLTTTLGAYVTQTSLTTQLGSYTTTAGLDAWATTNVFGSTKFNNTVDGIIRGWAGLSAGATATLATQPWVTSQIANIDKLTIQKVAELPATGVENVIYLVPKAGSANNVHEEYMWINNKWELIGSTSVDLTGYASLAGANTFTGNNTVTGTLTVGAPTTDTHASNKSYVDTAAVAAKNNAKSELLAAGNTFTGSNTFNKPVTVGTPTSGTHATTKAYVDSAIGSAGGGDAMLAGDNVFTGDNTFSKALTVGAPTAGTHASTKTYTDTAATAAKTAAKSELLAANNTFTGTNAFNGNTSFRNVTIGASVDFNSTPVNFMRAPISIDASSPVTINSNTTVNGKLVANTAPTQDNEVLRKIDIHDLTLRDGTALFEDQQDFPDILFPYYPNLATSVVMYANTGLNDVAANFTSLYDANEMFARSTIIIKNFNNLSFPALIEASNMFSYCTRVTHSVHAPILKYGTGMYMGSALKVLQHSYKDLIIGDSTFRNTSLTTTEKDTLIFPKLESGYCMFSKTLITESPEELPRVKDTTEMFMNCANLLATVKLLPVVTVCNFMYANCSKITKASYIIPNVTDAKSMYLNCTSLVALNIDFDMPEVNYSKLTAADNMLDGCTNLPVTEINALFRALPTKPANAPADKYKIGVKGCKTGYDASIATAKGWTVVSA